LDHAIDELEWDVCATAKLALKTTCRVANPLLRVVFTRPSPERSW
jgi:hypothetical protein